MKRLLLAIVLAMMAISAYAQQNQTNTTSPIILNETGLPFSITIEKANFQLPLGFHSGVFGVYKGLWVFIGGRTGGLHGFGGSDDNFPTAQQNTTIYVINPVTGAVFSRSLNDPASGLTQAQVDTLSVTSPQGYQSGNTLYMTGGYGVDTSTGLFTTKPVLTAINLPGIVNWVLQPNDSSNSVSKNIRQLVNPIFQVTGGEMLKLGNVTHLIFGQNFTGFYHDGSNGDYIQQVRRFQIREVNGQLVLDFYPPVPQTPDPSYRRRDMNTLPVIMNTNNKLSYGYVTYGGVFTLNSGVWTVPVVMNGSGNLFMNDPDAPNTFKQGMNQYVSAAAGLYSQKFKSMYNILFGGISFGYFVGNSFQTDTEIPFINQVTTVQMDWNGHFTQYLMNNQYPQILSTTVNPGNPLLFGAGAYFIPNPAIQKYDNGVMNLDQIRKPTLIGYIVGGIASTLANTNVNADSFGSTYVFKVTLIPKV